ncbi:MAG TPA: hypothetical protein VK530_06770, partial [Candidatus Acidoferrum sp.]|nr:hypothetical protein [Candidatus Acidoferrum sp.]
NAATRMNQGHGIVFELGVIAPGEFTLGFHCLPSTPGSPLLKIEETSDRISGAVQAQPRTKEKRSRSEPLCAGSAVCPATGAACTQTRECDAAELSRQQCLAVVLAQ